MMSNVLRKLGVTENLEPLIAEFQQFVNFIEQREAEIPETGVPSKEIIKALIVTAALLTVAMYDKTDTKLDDLYSKALAEFRKYPQQLIYYHEQ